MCFVVVVVGKWSMCKLGLLLLFLLILLLCLLLYLDYFVINGVRMVSIYVLSLLRI